MESIRENRSRWLKVRLKPTEYELVERRFQKSTFQSVSEFARAMLMGKPVRILTRDRSMDDLLEELTMLRKELNGIGNNLNQVVKSINSTHGHADSRLWIGLLSVIHSQLEPSIGQIKDQMNKCANLWLQKLKAEKA